MTYGAGQSFYGVFSRPFTKLARTGIFNLYMPSPKTDLTFGFLGGHSKGIFSTPLTKGTTLFLVLLSSSLHFLSLFFS
jgi:hypothetical protein